MHLKGSGLANLDKDPSIIPQPFPQSILDKYVHKYILELSVFLRIYQRLLFESNPKSLSSIHLPQIHTRMTKPRLFVN
jgi:hypothetical protein